ncbi:hypothetical protein ACFQ3P_30855 [Paraburkholderia sabiae]|uniref:Fis family transcriptional regulator n=1 Tax=Paraburkholderia sabiae TaxID=273251 RepID=A0ABU9QI08_9BURK|nr:hypothetical protein [Paraburkholderia sabiae]WJZ77416.1 hypothetical protein QEN71_35715 [Paraburkholderia sabiae]CAD6557732.1 hypothetical protein LMG24235_06202 [Paraburkholderia sabiae]
MKIRSSTLPGLTTNLIATRCHLALHAMRTANGTASTAKTLLEVVIVSGLLAELGYGQMSETTGRAAEATIRRVVISGLERGNWNFEEDEVQAICRIVAAFERQLEATPADEIEAAFEAAAKLGLS